MGAVDTSLEKPSALGGNAKGFAKRGSRGFTLKTAERAAVVAVGDATAAALGCIAAYVAWEASQGKTPAIPKLVPLLFAVAWLIALFLVDGYEVQIPASRVKSLVVVAKATPMVAF